jgi:hypothetical protein
MISPRVVVGARVSKAAGAVPCPVPPWAIVAVPEISVKAGCVADGTPLVEMVLIHFDPAAARDSIPPNVVAVGLGNRAAPSVPLMILLAFVVSIVEDGARSRMSAACREISPSGNVCLAPQLCGRLSSAY